jgi:uncharacterized protein YjiS (DUF1127 family)
MAAHGRIIPLSTSAQSTAPAPQGAGRGWLARLHEILSVAATRRQLAEADDRMLADLGISRAQARFEASRAPWDLD